MTKIEPVREWSESEEGFGHLVFDRVNKLIEAHNEQVEKEQSNTEAIEDAWAEEERTRRRIARTVCPHCKRRVGDEP